MSFFFKRKNISSLMIEIPEYKRDESKDYLIILKSLNEIPFPIGKKLLTDFLIEDFDNPSIEKNKLYDLTNFGGLKHISRGKIEELIDELIRKQLIDLSPSLFNKFIKVLSINRKGKEELIEPKLNSKEEKIEEKTIITDEEMKAFKELNDFLEHLNLEQKKAVVSNKPKIICIAGAGSGKTTILTKRIEFLNKLKKIKGEKILAITFTRKAKQEMQNRLEKKGITAVVETFNSYCEKILLRNTQKIYGRKVKVASFQDKMFAVLRALDQIGITFENAIDKYFNESQKRNRTPYQLQNAFINDCFSILDYYKNTKTELNDFSKNLSGKDKEIGKLIFEIIKFIQKYMEMNGLRTYNDQLSEALNFLKQYPKKIDEFEHILVDEYQDVNSSQVELLEILNPKNLFFVGDPRQAIFGWRGSSINYITDLIKNNEFEKIYLKKNYRSSKGIVDIMNEIVKDMNLENLEYEIEKKSIIELKNFENEEKEFEFILKNILESETPKKNIFVLSRTNKQLSELSLIFKKNKIPHILKNDENMEIEPKENEITLATIHSIKGLEAKEVYLLGCTKQNFPCRGTEHPIMEMIKTYEYDKDKEEKRLFYVAISRAKEKLYLTYSGKNHTYFITEEIKKMIK